MLEEAVVTARDIMTPDVAAVHPETSLLDAVTLMAQRRISGMPVVDDAGTIVGMLSEGDLLRWSEGYTERQARWLDMVAEGGDIAPQFLAVIREQRHKVSSAMSPGAITVAEDTLAREIAHLMHAKGIKRVPVLREGKLVGIVARSDLVRALAAKLAEPAPARPAPADSIDEALRRGRAESNAAVPGRTLPPR